MTTPDSRIGWIAPAVRAGLRVIRECRPDVIYSTSPYASAHLISLLLSLFTKTRWVADFRDPWRGNPFTPRRHPMLEWWDGWLERRVLRQADWVVCNTPTAAAQLCARAPWVGRKCSTILNGYDSDVFAQLQPVRTAPSNHCVLTHCGQFYGARSPAAWFAALRRLLERAPELAVRLHLDLIGSETFKGGPLSKNQRPDGIPLMELAAAYGVAGQVRVFGPKTQAEALAHMAGSDALMLAGSSGPGAHLQVPNKLLEYLAVRKPIIAAVPANSPVVSILREARAPARICDPADEVAIESALMDTATGRLRLSDGAFSGVGAFERGRRAIELARVFEAVCGFGGQDTTPADRRGQVVAAGSAPAARVRGKRRNEGPVDVTRVYFAPTPADAS